MITPEMSTAFIQSQKNGREMRLPHYPPTLADIEQGLAEPSSAATCWARVAARSRHKVASRGPRSLRRTFLNMKPNASE